MYIVRRVLYSLYDVWYHYETFKTYLINCHAITVTSNSCRFSFFVTKPYVLQANLLHLWIDTCIRYIVQCSGVFFFGGVLDTPPPRVKKKFLFYNSQKSDKCLKCQAHLIRFQPVASFVLCSSIDFKYNK